MAKKSPISVGEIQFETKKECIDFIKAIKDKYSLGSVVCGVDLNFLLELIRMHPEAETKIGCGVLSIEIRMNDMGNATGFYIVRHDKTTTDFSYLKCINGQDGGLKKFNNAARESVKEQVIQFRESYFKKNQNVNGEIKCEVSGELVSRDERDVDHHPESFNSLIKRFISNNGIDVDLITYEGVGDSAERLIFSDRSIGFAFSEFHKGEAGLRVVSRGANLRKQRKASI